MRRIVLLSGPIASGKTSVSSGLEEQFGFKVLKTRELIEAETGSEPERRQLQRAGDKLDRERPGRWIASALSKLIGDLPNDVVIDAVRIKSQIDGVRDAFQSQVVHVHLTANLAALSHRYAQRVASIKEVSSYKQARQNRTERRVDELRDCADVVIYTDRSTPQDVLVRVAGAIGLYGRSPDDRLVDVLIGGQFGSEGKGNIAAHLSPEYDILLRVGGANAGHTVFKRPNHERYHHLPSGTTRGDAIKVLGPGSVLHVPGLMKEIAEAREFAAIGRLFIDPAATLVEESDKTFERESIKGTLGSTASGVGYATARRVMRGALGPVRLAKDAPELLPYLKPTAEILRDAYAKGKRVLLEGTQGTGLSLYHGSYFHVTSRDTTASGCMAEAGVAPTRVRNVVMVCRTYPIRVESPSTDNSSGPMGASELTWELIHERSRVPIDEIRETEITTTTRRKRRVSEFNWTAVREASMLNGATDLALTFADYIDVENRRARRYEQLTPETVRFIEELERVTCARVSLITTRFHYRGIIDRRLWGRQREGPSGLHA